MYFKSTESNEEPKALEYAKLPNGKAYVMLRKNIRTETRTDENKGESTVYVYDEVQFITEKTKEDVQSHQEDLFRMHSGSIPSVEERLKALEAAVVEIGGML